MIHLGDITKIDGISVEPVWCVTGGSPCQDLSIAGKRAGLAGARSGLFMEQIRVIKEMREHDKQLGRTGELIRPRYMVWENVPGALSSNKGRDFAAVLEETIRIVEPEAPSVEVPAKGWPTWGGYRDVDGRWSVAWRVHDAQYWGVPQRRRRIALVADFGGDTAHEILFERKSVSGDLEPRGEEGERSAGNAESGVNPAVARSLTARADGSPCIDRGPNIVVQQVFDMTHACDVIRECGEIVPSLQARMGMGGNQVPLTYQMQGFGDYRQADVSSSCKQRDYKDSTDLVVTENVSPTLRANSADPYRADMAAYVAQPRNTYSQSGAVCMTPWDSQSARVYSSEGVFHSLNANESGGQSRDSVFCNMVVRRLTPLECERLQGFPDGWTDIGDYIDSTGKKRKTSDSARYKALGNSIALPFWHWMFGRMAAYLPEGATLGSLFDGIGGFPLCWEDVHGAGTAKWASEIEEFPMAVTKLRFGCL